MLLVQTQVSHPGNSFDQQIIAGVDRFLTSVASDAEFWKRVWQDRLDREVDASEWNLKRSVGGTMDVETLTHFLYLRGLAEGSLPVGNRTTNTLQMLDQLVAAGLLDGQSGKWLSDSYRLLRLVELYLRLMDLPDRHSLPIHQGETEQPAIGPERETGESPNLGFDLQEMDQTGVKTIPENSILQQVLASLMDYDRFDSLVEEIRDCMSENRRLILEIAARF